MAKPRITWRRLACIFLAGVLMLSGMVAWLFGSSKESEPRLAEVSVVGYTNIAGRKSVVLEVTNRQSFPIDIRIGPEQHWIVNQWHDMNPWTRSFPLGTKIPSGAAGHIIQPVPKSELPTRITLFYFQAYSDFELLVQDGMSFLGARRKERRSYRLFTPALEQ